MPDSSPFSNHARAAALYGGPESQLFAPDVAQFFGVDQPLRKLVHLFTDDPKCPPLGLPWVQHLYAQATNLPFPPAPHPVHPLQLLAGFLDPTGPVLIASDQTPLILVGHLHGSTATNPSMLLIFEHRLAPIFEVGFSFYKHLAQSAATAASNANESSTFH